MRKIIFFGIFCLFLISPILAFAYSRQEAINRTLAKMETSSSSRQTSYFAASDINSKKKLSYSFNNDIPKNKSDQREEAIKAAFYIAAAIDSNRIHYSEWEGKRKRNEDFGTHRGYSLAIGYKSPNYYEWVNGYPFIECYFRRFGNIIRYKGALIGGGPFDTYERSVVKQYGVKIGATRDFLDKGSILGYLDIGRRIWYRDEDGRWDNIILYGEKYSWVYLGLGAGINYELLPRLLLGFEAEWLTTLPRTRKMHANNFGYGDVTFKLGYVWGGEVKLPVKYYILKNLSLDVTPYFTYWKIKRSDYVELGGSYWHEPDSKTHFNGVLAGFTCAF
ncbi:MAG: hypothetical protein NC923_05370 [Candidatus Omnitrophica bacterium]|nr:hypothetical protein [Candidatus Omnitrophota bacterium]